jgi:hypothetical protein
VRLVVNPSDEVSLKRVLNVPKRRIGDTSVAKLDAFAAREGITFLDALRRADEAGVGGPASRGIDTFVEVLDASRDALMSWATARLGPGDRDEDAASMIWTLSGLPELYAALSARIAEGPGNEALSRIARAAMNLASGLRLAQSVTVSATGDGRLPDPGRIDRDLAALADRPADILPLARSMLERHRHADAPAWHLSDSAAAALLSHPWIVAHAPATAAALGAVVAPRASQSEPRSRTTTRPSASSPNLGLNTIPHSEKATRIGEHTRGITF